MAVTPTVLASGTVASGASSFNSASISPNSDEVIYACVAWNFAGDPGAEGDVISVSGNSLTWVRVAEVQVERRRIGVFRALGTATSGAVTFSEASGGDPQFRNQDYCIVQFANASTAGTNGSGATGTPATGGATTGTSLGLTITGTPGANDATFAYFGVEDGATSVASDALWATLDNQTGNGDYAATKTDWDSGADLSPTWTWTNSKRNMAIGFIVIAPAAGGGATVTPDTKALTTATFAPIVTASDHKIVTPDTVALTTSTFAPTVTASDHKTVTPDTAALTVATFAPTVTVSDNQTVTPDTAALSLSTFAPTVTATANQTFTPDTASLALTTFEPTVTATGSVAVTPGTVSLTLSTFAPTVTATDIAPAPAPRRREGGAMYAPSQEMEKFALALRDDQDLMMLAPMLAFIAEQNRTIQ